MKVIVTGASGLLGHEMADIFEENTYRTIRLMGRKSVDITKPKEIIEFVTKEKPDCVIHCAGSREIDAMEDSAELGYLSNTFGTKNVALACESAGCKLVYISSDAVYDGEKIQGYHEFDATNPINVYGKSKLLAEKEVKSYCSKYFIIRTALLFGYKGHRENNFIFNIIDTIKKGEKIYANNAQICSPSYTKDLGEAILKMVETTYYGIYNVSNSEIASRYDLSREVAEMLGLDEELVISADAALSGKKAKRPKNTVFHSLTFEKTFNIKMQSWQNALNNCIEDIKAKKL
ncbi:MAG: SDR family oxidoreductase [Eubacteriales bacterium]